MKKVGIITIIDYDNYGNRLQNYAAQEVLRILGLESETIVNKPINPKNLSLKLKRFFNRPNKEMVMFLIKKTNTVIKKSRQGIYKTESEKEQFTKNQRIEKFKKDREKRFKEFTKENIKETPYTITPDTIPKDFHKNYDYFIVGSDQVWNPTFRLGSSIDFLTFAKPEQRIAYAPSFGVSAIPCDFKEDYQKWLLEFKALSVREDAGADIIKNLTNREASVLVDPTVMLTKDEWLSIAKPHRLKPNNPFLLTYFLGEIPKEVRALISKLSKGNNIEVVNLGSYEQIDRYAADPSEFIDYINSADIFLTDSFHGAVFSIILEKQFIVFNRVSKVPSMNSRIDTLLTKFNLIDRKWESVKQSQDYFGADFSHTEPIFEYERSKAYSYLNNALNIEDAN